MVKQAMNDVEKTIIEFLSDSDPLIKQMDEVPIDLTLELYDMLEVCAQASSENIKSLDTNLRVEICNKLDLVLEHIVDIVPFSIQADANIYTPAVQGYRQWKNVELMKDKGLTGYMLAKEVGANPVMMFCSKPEDYSYLTDLPHMQLLYTDSQSGSSDVYYKYLLENYDKMDILILHGMYQETIMYLDYYRMLRPDGKVYCGLDLNSYWMDRIEWENPQVQKFAAQCDLIATSCKSLRDALNRNPSVSFSCRYLPNGFYNPTEIPVVADSGSKENTIITVGRIGSPQKNNYELMIAFAHASPTLKNWKLKFIGNIEPEFQPVISQYFAIRPDLKESVIFTGPIADKSKLYEEYAKAKIFALTSQVEGGSPNVYAEALFHGCMIITSDIDAADDMINFSALGEKYKLGDIEGLTNLLVKMCSNAGSQVVEKHIHKALAYGSRYYDWERNAKKLTYALLRPTNRE